MPTIEEYIKTLQKQEADALRMLEEIRHQIQMEFERWLQESFGVGVGDLITTKFGVARVSGLMRLSPADFQNGSRPWLLANIREQDGRFRDKLAAFYNWEPYKEEAAPQYRAVSEKKEGILKMMKIDDETLDHVEREHGVCAADRLRDWEHMLRIMAHECMDTESLETVNQFFNTRIRYASDIEVWGIKEFWATPFEFLCKGAGDCEDFAIAKFFTLKQAGIPEENLNIMYCRRVNSGAAHMTLGYYRTPEAEPLILDNLIDEIRTESGRKDLRLLLGFNTYGLWPVGHYGTGGAMLAASRLREWRNLQTRLAEANKLYGEAKQGGHSESTGL